MVAVGAEVVEVTGMAEAAGLQDAVVTMGADLYICAGAGEVGANLVNEIGNAAAVGDEDGALAGASDGDIEKAALLGVGIGVGCGEHSGS